MSFCNEFRYIGHLQDFGLNRAKVVA
jgi:hypothetical protein